MKKNKENKIDLSKEVMKTIKQENLQIKPKWYFVLASFMMSFAAISLMGTSIFTINLIFFKLRMNSMMERSVPAYTFIWHFFLYRFPWSHFLLLILLMVLGFYLLKKYEFSYKKDWRLIVLGVIVALLVSGFVIDKVGVNEHLKQKPPMRRFYDQGPMPPQPLPQPVVKGARR